MSGPVVRSLTNRWVAARLLPRPARAHKGDFGRVQVVGGSAEYPGAALLTGLGAMRAGAGVVQIATARTVADRLAGVVPELTWLVLDEEPPGLIAPSGWRLATSAAASFDALVIGPGLGRLQGTQRRVRGLVGTVGVPTVVDADGLNALAEDPRWPQGIEAELVMTPHPGEFARLIGSDPPPADDDSARAAAAAEAAERWGQVVVLKGAHTVVAAPGGQVIRSSIASPALATAGSGDVLAGVIGAFLAGGAPRFEAAACGVAVHAAAGVLAQRRIGRAGTMARDVVGLLPEAMERLRSGRAG